MYFQSTSHHIYNNLYHYNHCYNNHEYNDLHDKIHMYSNFNKKLNDKKFLFLKYLLNKHINLTILLKKFFLFQFKYIKWNFRQNNYYN